MKYLVIFLLFVIQLSAFSMSDSTTINFFGVRDENQELTNELLNIQIMNISCNDTNMRGKKFLLNIHEITNGRVTNDSIIKTDCGPKEIKFEFDGKTFIENIDYCELFSFPESKDSLVIRLGGRLENDTFRLALIYPKGGMKLKIPAKEDYQLRTVNQCQGIFEQNIPINKKAAIMTYSPPFKSSQAGSYCIRGEEDVEKWYEKFKIKHYYIVFLEIRD